MEHCFVAHSIASPQIGFWWNLNKFSTKNCFFHLYNRKSPFLSLPIAAKILKMTWTGGNPWPNFPRDKPFGMFAAFSSSWGIWFKFNFTWKKYKNFSNFSSSSSGSKKLSFVHTTKLASECMWKAPFKPRQMRPTTFQYKLLTLTYVIFLLNRNTFPEFPQLLSWQSFIFNSTVVVNYPNQASYERTWVFLTVFVFPCAY